MPAISEIWTFENWLNFSLFFFFSSKCKICHKMQTCYLIALKFGMQKGGMVYHGTKFHCNTINDHKVIANHSWKMAFWKWLHMFLWLVAIHFLWSNCSVFNCFEWSRDILFISGCFFFGWTAMLSRLCCSSTFFSSLWGF